MTSGAPVGLLLGSHIPPWQIRENARLGEELGFSELWLAEDYFLTGAISAAAACLGATERIPVGLGVVSAVVRNPAVLAMECSTLAGMYPGRIWPGIGLGFPPMLAQMGLHPASQLATVRECASAVRRLLAGEELTEAGAVFSFAGAKIAYPVAEPPPLYLGVIGPKMLELSGEVADGTVGSVLAGVEYIRSARERIAAGQRRAGREGEPHRFACFAFFSVDRDGQAARDALRPVMAWYLAQLPKSPLSDAYGIGDELVELARGGVEGVARGLRDEWMNDLAVVGDPDECAAQIRRLLAAGADSVVLYPLPMERSAEVVRLGGAEVLPRLAG